jgi:hypothetical protein
MTLCLLEALEDRVRLSEPAWLLGFDLGVRGLAELAGTAKRTRVDLGVGRSVGVR